MRDYNKLCRHCKHYWPFDVYSGECRNKESEKNEIYLKNGWLTHYTIVCGCETCNSFEEDKNA